MTVRFVSSGLSDGALVISVRTSDALDREIKQVHVRLPEPIPGIAGRAKAKMTDEDATRDAAAAWAMDRLRDTPLEDVPEALDARHEVANFMKSDTRRFLNADKGKPLV
jgi:hypothetical protein